MPDDKVQIWDEEGKEVDIGKADVWDTWDKCAAAPGFPKGLVQFLRDTQRGCGFPAPSSIQRYAWPALVTGKDLIGVAKTGSGKTLAFLLPGFMWLKKNKKSDNPVDTSIGPALLTLTPTRELCIQIHTDAEKFGMPVKITAACAYGGAPAREQEAKLRESPDCLIATPGRLSDFLRRKACCLDGTRYVVLDEADRMLDMGFQQEVSGILEWCPKDKQVAMFTATWGKGVRALADKYISKPLQVQIGSGEITANTDIEQNIKVCYDDKEKTESLKSVIDSKPGSCLVFCKTKRKCGDLAWELGNIALELHGDLQQSARDNAIDKFRAGEVSVLVATDVASRGLDIRNIMCVVNYDAPQNTEDFVHRIGRTGRAGDKGVAHTFLSRGDEQKAHDIMQLFIATGLDVPDNLKDFAAGARNAWGSGGGKDWKQEETKSTNGGGGGTEGKRIHPSDKTNTAYTFEEFKGFAGDDKKAEKMWGESKVVEEEKKPSGGGGTEGKRIHPSDKTNTAYTFEEFKGFAGDDKKAERMWGESKVVEEEIKPSGGTERRVHSSDKEKKPYTFEEFKGFAGDDKKAEKMWNESTVHEEPVETANDDKNDDKWGKKDDDKWWEKKDDEKKEDKKEDEKKWDNKEWDEKKDDKAADTKKPGVSLDELKAMKVSQVKLHARSVGVADDLIEATDDADDRKQALIDLIVSKQEPDAPVHESEEEGEADAPDDAMKVEANAAEKEDEADAAEEDDEVDEKEDKKKDEKEADNEADEDADKDNVQPSTPDAPAGVDAGDDEPMSPADAAPEKRPAEEEAAEAPAAKVAKKEPNAPSDEELSEMKNKLLGGQVQKLTVAQLKSFLASTGKSIEGLKKDLQSRAIEAATE